MGSHSSFFHVPLPTDSFVLAKEVVASCKLLEMLVLQYMFLLLAMGLIFDDCCMNFRIGFEIHKLLDPTSLGDEQD